MSRIGTNPNISSDQLEARMLPDVEDMQPEEGGTLDLMGDGVHKIYLNRWQLEVRNFGSRSTKVRAGRGTGKTSFIGVHMTDVTIGLPRQMGGFVGASAKQLYTRTMPNALKVVSLLGYEQFFFLGQAPAKLRWETPLAKPRNWENCVHFQNGFVWQMISMAVKGSANGLNLAAIVGDETKYLPWQKVKEEVLPTLRGDFMPPSARKVQQKRWGYGTDPKINHHWLSQLWVSDAGLTQKQSEWERDKQYETRDVNEKIATMLAELKYLQKHNPRMAVELSQNDNFLRQLHLLRSQSESFWNLSSAENLSMLGGEAFLRQMQRELPPLLYAIMILGAEKGAAKDGFYCNLDIDSVHGYTEEEYSQDYGDSFSMLADKFTVKKKGTALDAQNWPTRFDTETLDLDELGRLGDADTCELDMDLRWDQPLLISFDANANISCMVVGQAIGDELLIQRSLFVLNERKLRALCRQEFGRIYKPFLRRGCGEVILYFTATVKQGASTAYAVEDGDDNRFDRVVVQELKDIGFKVTAIDTGAPLLHSVKYQLMSDLMSGVQTPRIRICKDPDRNTYLIPALENAGVVPGTFRKDKSREKLKATDEESLGGDPRTRTDITDAFDDLVIGVKYHGITGRPKLGGSLRGRYQHLRIPR